MADVVRIGPLALATDRLAAVILIWLFLAACAWIARRTEGNSVRAGWLALGAGLVAARIAYVAQNLDAFAVEPLSILYVWQGGFAALYGIAAAAIVLLLMLRGRVLRSSLGALLVLGIAWMAFDAAMQRAPARPLSASLAATTLQGAPFDFAALRGRPFVVNLWATWCPPCLREMPMLVQTAAANPDVAILLVNQGEDAARVANYLGETGLRPDNVLLDPALTFAAAAGGGALPTTLFVDADGQIRRTHAGEISRAALLSGIREMKETTR